MNMTVILVVVAVVVNTAVGAAIGKSKNDTWNGLVLGFWLSVFGWVLEACMPRLPDGWQQRERAASRG